MKSGRELRESINLRLLYSEIFGKKDVSSNRSVYVCVFIPLKLRPLKLTDC